MKKKVLLWCLAALPLVIFLVLMTLKLVDVISWSWWWITAPIWMPIALLSIACLVLIFYVERHTCKNPEEFNRNIDRTEGR